MYAEQVHSVSIGYANKKDGRKYCVIFGLKKKKPSYRDFRSGDVRHSQASIEKAKKLLDYQPKYKISEGMDEAIDWYVNSLS